MTTRQSPRATRKPYKVTVALFQWEWDDLLQWTILRGISGGELVSSILSTWLQHNELPELDPSPDESPEDA